MPKLTLNLPLSEAAIKKHADDLNVYQLNDPRHPVRFRYRNDRGKGSWYVVRFAGGRQKWRKAANWPEVSVRHFLERVPEVMARLMVDPDAQVAMGNFTNAEQVLGWYYERLLADATLSPSRRSSMLSLIRTHLRPKLGHLQLTELTAASLDRCLVWPMLAAYSASYVRSAFQALKLVFGAALDLEQIAVNPLERATFSRSTKVKILPKGVRLRHTAVVDLLYAWHQLFLTDPADVVFALMMLCHGSRISETRKAKWPNLHLAAGEWFIPAADTKSKRDHVLPLTPQLVAFLTRYREWQKSQGYEGVYLFPSPNRSGKPLSRSASFEIFDRLGAGAWSSHDLRKLARECWAKLKVDSLTVKLLLNHSLTELERTYFQSRGDEIKRDALEHWHGWLDAQGFDLLHGETAVRQPEKRAAVDPAGWLV